MNVRPILCPGCGTILVIPADPHALPVAQPAAPPTACVGCGAALPAGRRTSWCSRACYHRAYRAALRARVGG